jgi:hypothetical protein
MVCGDGEKRECEVKGVRPVRKESNWSREIGKKRRGYRKGDSYLLSTPHVYYILSRCCALGRCCIYSSKAHPTVFWRVIVKTIPVSLSSFSLFT